MLHMIVLCVYLKLMLQVSSQLGGTYLYDTFLSMNWWRTFAIVFLHKAFFFLPYMSRCWSNYEPYGCDHEMICNNPRYSSCEIHLNINESLSSINSIIQNHRLMSTRNYKPCHIRLHCRCAVKKNDQHIIPPYSLLMTAWLTTKVLWSKPGRRSREQVWVSKEGARGTWRKWLIIIVPWRRPPPGGHATEGLAYTQ